MFFSKEDFTSSDCLSPPTPLLQVHWLLLRPHQPVHALTFEVWSIHPALGITGLCSAWTSKQTWASTQSLPHLQSVINTAALSRVSPTTLREEQLLDLSHVESVVFLSSGVPCLSALSTRPLCCWFSDSRADITAVYLCFQGLIVIYFIWTERMLSNKLLQML